MSEKMKQQTLSGTSLRFSAHNLNPVELHTNRLTLCSFLILCSSCTMRVQEPVNPRNLLPGDGITSVKTLAQNWSDVESRAFYNAPQGSQLIPYRWFLHLEQHDNDKPFLDPDHIRALGYLPRSPDSFGNPYGLPIGFVRDVPFSDGTPALGMSCAACHTTQINHNNTAWLIDGAPTLGDVATFMQHLQAALKATIDDEGKFERFAVHVLPQATPDEELKLKRRMQRFEALRRDYNERNTPAKHAPQFGHGRIVAFGAILNEVTVTALGISDNQRTADAPVSYPFLWDTPQHNFVQWNGVAPNTVSSLASLFVHTKYIGALGRNTGEVLGVFGNLSVDHRNIVGGYTSSVDHRSLIDIEDSLRKLWSPLFSQKFGDIDDKMSNAGRGIFNEHCASCHTNNGTEYKFVRTDPKRTVNARLEAVETDSTMYLNFVLRRAKTGKLKGRFASFGHLARLKAEEPAARILSHVVERVVVGPNFDKALFRPEHLAALEIPMPLNLSFRTSEGLLTGNFKHITPHGGKEAYLISGEDICFTPHAGTPQEGETLALSVLHDGTAHFRGETKSFAADRFKTLFEIRPVVDSSGTRVTGSQLRVTADSIVVKYKSRTLNGIWATAPYLHNGSVPNLWELLKPAKDRTTAFWVGSRQFDEINVGFRSDEGLFQFDTTRKGNSNAGHEYGTELIDERKWELIEYLKSL